VTQRPEFNARIYLTLFFNCVFVILCKGVGKGILNIAVGNSSDPVLTWYYIGGLAGCLIYIAIYAFFSMAFIWLGNITFACLAMGLLCNAFIKEIPHMAVAFAILLGIGSTVGMINMYYIIGVVGKKYNSMRYVRFSILFIGICGGVSGVLLGRLIQEANTFEVSMAASIFSVAVMLLFMALSPLVSQTHYFDDWAKDSGIREIDNGRHDAFQKYGLSRREREVCELLLQGYTLRQISGILSIAYSTVNTYCTSSYRKLGINSRTELLILFKDYVVK
jgi:DNA-binding CsgD family transcriptional regulator